MHLANEDPDDRFLAGTADADHLTLVTADERLPRRKDVRARANR